MPELLARVRLDPPKVWGNAVIPDPQSFVWRGVTTTVSWTADGRVYSFSGRHYSMAYTFERDELWYGIAYEFEDTGELWGAYPSKDEAFKGVTRRLYVLAEQRGYPHTVPEFDKDGAAHAD